MIVPSFALYLSCSTVESIAIVCHNSWPVDFSDDPTVEPHAPNPRFWIHPSIGPTIGWPCRGVAVRRVALSGIATSGCANRLDDRFLLGDFGMSSMWMEMEWQLVVVRWAFLRLRLEELSERIGWRGVWLVELVLGWIEQIFQKECRRSGFNSEEC